MTKIEHQNCGTQVYKPNQFQVNETWIAFKLNDVPVSTSADGDFNVLALMDAASCFILSIECFHASSLEPSLMESKRLLKAGKSHKQQYPKSIFIPTNQEANILTTEAELQGIAVVRVPEKQLLVLIGEALQTFRNM